MKNKLKQSLFLLLLSFLATTCSEKKQLNIIFILVDDLGWTDLACYGSTFHETPQIDALAKESMLFTNAYASCPVCSPTRASLLTGKYPSRLNITDWIPGQTPPNTKLLGPEDLHALPLEEVTFAEVLQEKGYQTFFGGKWHLGGEGYYPEQQGFQINKGGHDKGSPPGGYYSPYKNPKLEDGPEGEYLPDRLTNEAISFIQANKDKPFLAYLSYYTVHTPIQASKRHLDRFQTKPDTLLVPEGEGTTVAKPYNTAYASMVYALDENIGRLIAALEAADLKEETILIFTSDNGGLSTLEKNRVAPTSVRPLRAGKGWCHEGGIRVPLIIKVPGAGFQTGTNDIPVISMDLYPTILELLDLPTMPEQHVDGKSIVGVLQNKSTLDRSSLFWHYPHYHGSAWKPGAAVRVGDWKLVKSYHYGTTDLYNLKLDLGEQENLAAQYPEKVKALEDSLLYWQEKTGAKFPVENLDY